ncbi:MAG: PIN domain-containing protein, partial [Promethearchaeota archaeon]
MPKQIILDTGCITLLLGKKPPKQILNLFENIENGKNTAYIITPVISEVYKHLCIRKGKEFASSSLISVMDRYPIVLIDQDISLLFKAGELKCRYRTKLSYIDCFVVA